MRGTCHDGIFIGSERSLHNVNDEAASTKIIYYGCRFCNLRMLVIELELVTCWATINRRGANIGT
jgi:hypothetical protein